VSKIHSNSSDVVVRLSAKAGEPDLFFTPFRPDAGADRRIKRNFLVIEYWLLGIENLNGWMVRWLNGCMVKWLPLSTTRDG